MSAIAYHADLNEVQGDARLSALLGPDAQSAPFDRLAWWQGLVKHCGLEAFVAVAENDSSLAVLPLRQGKGRLEALANWYSFHTRPLLIGAQSPELLRELAADLAKRTRRLTLTGVPDEDGSATRIAEAFRSAGWVVHREPCDINHVLEVGGRSYDQYLATRPGPLRSTLKRKANKVEVQILDRFDHDAWAEYEDIYRESWKPAEGSPDFLRAFAEEEGVAGRLRLGIARVGERAVAAQVWTVEGGCAFIHKLAYREEARPLSPGTTLSAALFRHVIDLDAVSLVDFGTGNDRYKRDWMETERPRYCLDMLRVTSPRNWPVLAREIARKLARKANHG